MRNRTFGAVFFFLLSGMPGLARPVEQYTEPHFLTSSANAREKALNLAVLDRDGGHVNEALIRQLSHKTFFFTGGMTIDADGAPNAYHPDDIGIDELANAGSPGHWNGIITDRRGNPLIQQEADPFPGYYISCTTLVDKSKKFDDPSRYVDATKIPYVALPEEIAESGGVHLGDFAFVINLHNGKSSFAIYADIGSLGEGSAHWPKGSPFRRMRAMEVSPTEFYICSSPVQAIGSPELLMRSRAKAKNCYPIQVKPRNYLQDVTMGSSAAANFRTARKDVISTDKRIKSQIFPMCIVSSRARTEWEVSPR